MKLIIRFTGVAGIFAALACSSGAEITGKIVLKGTPPPEQEIVEFKQDASCGPLRPDVPKTRLYVVSPKGELADVVVALKGVTGKSSGERAQPALIDQRLCEYQPYVSAVQTRQKILVKNSDPQVPMHNVHVTPTSPANKEDNKGMLPNSPDISFTFNTPEDFLRFKCDVHEWMFSYVSVFDHPYFAVSDKEGRYTITNVPPGKYSIEARHRKAGFVTKEIEVGTEKVTTDFQIELK